LIQSAKQPKWVSLVGAEEEKMIRPAEAAVASN